MQEEIKEGLKDLEELEARAVEQATQQHEATLEEVSVVQETAAEKPEETEKPEEETVEMKEATPEEVSVQEAAAEKPEPEEDQEAAVEKPEETEKPEEETVEMKEATPEEVSVQEAAAEKPEPEEDQEAAVEKPEATKRPEEEDMVEQKMTTANIQENAEQKTEATTARSSDVKEAVEETEEKAVEQDAAEHNQDSMEAVPTEVAQEEKTKQKNKDKKRAVIEGEGEVDESSGHSNDSADMNMDEEEGPEPNDVELYKLHMVFLGVHLNNETHKDWTSTAKTTEFEQWFQSSRTWSSLVYEYSDSIHRHPLYSTYLESMGRENTKAAESSSSKDDTPGGLPALDIQLSDWVDFLNAPRFSAELAHETVKLLDICKAHPCFHGFQGEQQGEQEGDKFRFKVQEFFSWLTLKGKKHATALRSCVSSMIWNALKAKTLGSDNKPLGQGAVYELETGYRYPGPPSNNHPDINVFLESTTEVLATGRLVFRFIRVITITYIFN